MSARVPFANPYDHLVYMRVFEGCNLHCEHCFIPKNPKKMTHDIIAESVVGLRKFIPEGSRILVQWHGGEPTMFGAKWLESAMDRLEAAGPEFIWMHGIQTNLMTYSAEWADLYQRRFEGAVGVSWDPKIRLLTKGNRDSNAIYEEKFWNNLGKLLDDGLDPYMVMTATKIFFDTFHNPIDLFEKLASYGVRKAHIERLTETGYARENWDYLGVDNLGWSKGMSRILRAYELWRSIDNNGSLLALSPFDGLMASLANIGVQGSGYGCWSGKCDTRFHTVDASGYKMGCTALNSEMDNKNSGGQMLQFSASYKESRSNRTIINCNQCAFRSVCSSGCLALSMDDGSGECSGGKKLFETALNISQIRGKEG